MQYITRIAPSPTGQFHLGTARTALFNYLAAKSSYNHNFSGKKIDRLYYQSERIKIYQQIAFDLVKANLSNELDNGAIALATTAIELPNSFLDTIGGNIAITDTNKQQIKQVILLR